MACDPTENHQKASARKTPEDDNIDRLSALPDGVLHHIMWFLPIKHAAATSILSMRWRNLFTSLPDINLQIWGIRNPHIANDVDYRKLWNEINIGYQVLILRNRAPIRKFQLQAHWYVERFGFAIESLISIALLCMVQELDVSGVTKHIICLISPQIFSCKTLVSLKMSSDVDLVKVLPNSVSLPNLKVLHLRGEMKVVDGTCVGNLIKGCPLLEELNLVLIRLDKRTRNEVVDFSSPYLKKLILSSSNFGGQFDFIVRSDKLEYLEFCTNGKHGFTLDAPNLKYLNYKGKSGQVNFRFIHSLKAPHVTATIAIRYRFAEIFGENSQKSLLLGSQQVLELISGLQSVKSLYLCEHSLLALYFSGGILPTFKNLTTLHLEASFTGFDHGYFWTTLPRLLQSAPNLEVLIFSQVFNNVSHGDSFLFECIPICFIDHLKEIQLKKFDEEEHEFKLVEYILNNGKSLKKMTIGVVTKTLNSRPPCCNRILSFQKSSKDCRIVFNWKQEPSFRLR